jgi:hypothetical protein
MRPMHLLKDGYSYIVSFHSSSRVLTSYACDGPAVVAPVLLLLGYCLWRELTFVSGCTQLDESVRRYEGTSWPHEGNVTRKMWECWIILSLRHSPPALQILYSSRLPPPLSPCEGRKEQWHHSHTHLTLYHRLNCLRQCGKELCPGCVPIDLVIGMNM